MAPLHRAVFTAIHERILSGEWAEASLMPTEAELCDLHRVSRITVRRALDELARLGLVERIQGKGTFVRRARLRSGAANEGFRDMMGARGMTVTSRLLDSSPVPDDHGIAGILGLGEERTAAPPAWHFRRLRLVDGVPMAIMNTYVERGLALRMLARDLERESFYTLYNILIGMPVARTDGTVSAVTPDAEACSLLDVPPGSAHLWYRSVGYLEDGRPVEASFSIFNGFRYEFSVSGFRLKEGDGLGP